MRILGGRRAVYMAVSVSVLLIVAFAVLMPYLYDRVRRGAAEVEGASAEAGTSRPLTHDELLGPPLSFETPAYISIPAIGLDEEVREGRSARN